MEERRAFWNELIREGGDYSDPCHLIPKAVELLEEYPLEVSGIGKEIFGILFKRFDGIIKGNPFENVCELVISLLAALAPVAPMKNLMVQGLFESIFVVFLNNQKTFEGAVKFIDRFFDRDDIETVFEDVLMVTVINLANFSPPKISLWRFLCKFMTKFGEKIENLVDFSSVESNGMMPIFTRSLIWTYRNIYQNPPEKNHEEVFWKLWESILPRYLQAASRDGEPAPVILLFKGLMSEIRLSIYWAMQTTTSEMEVPKSVLRTLYQIDSDTMIVFLRTQFPCPALSVTLRELLPVASPEHQAQLKEMSL